MYLNPLSMYIYKVCLRKRCLELIEHAYVYSARHVLIYIILPSITQHLHQRQRQRQLRHLVVICRMSLYLDLPVDEPFARSCGH